MKTYTQEELCNMDKTITRTKREFLKQCLENGEEKQND